MDGYPSGGNYTVASTLGHGRKRAASRANTGVYRSVLDYETEDQLRAALLTSQSDVAVSEHVQAMIAALQDGQPVQKVARTSEDRSELNRHLEWVLPQFDPVTTKDQYVDNEVKRLQMVKHYLLDDSQRLEAFERITDLTKRLFDVPFAFISLIDLGRQWHVAHRGSDLQEVHLKDSLCTVAILSKAGHIVVPDLTQDPRFDQRDIVVGPPFVRFYAAAALISPEGYKVGTLCILDTVARPHGLTDEQENTLLDLADMALKVMVDRHSQLEKERQEDPVQILANAAHDLVAPLMGIQLSLSLLKDDEGVKSVLGEQHMELINTAVSSSDLLRRICRNALDTFHRQSAATNGTTRMVPHQQLLGGTTLSDNAIATTRLDSLVKNLHMVVDPMPKKTPCIITLDQSSPNEVIADDLKLFRSALNLLTSALGRTETGTIHLKIGVVPTSSLLLFECEDTGVDIPVEAYVNLFRSPNHNESFHHYPGLSSIASLVNSMDGEYGFRPRGIDTEGSILTDRNGVRRSGSVFWFSVPLHTVATSNFSHLLANANSSPYPIHQFSQPIPVGEPPLSNNGVNATPLGMLFQAGMSLEPQQGQQHRPPQQRQRPQQQSFCRTGTCGDAIANLAATMAPVGMSDEVAAIMEQLGDFEPYPIEGIASASTEINTTRARRRRILIIDDSFVIRRNLADVVNKLGYEAIHASDGVNGLKEMQQSLFDVVFCDFTMPIMDGLTCASRFRDWEKVNRPWDHQLIVGISEYAELNDRGQGLQAGMDMFYPKPITMKTVSGIQANNDVVLRTKQLDQWEASLRQVNPTQLESSRQNEAHSHPSMGNVAGNALPQQPTPSISLREFGKQETTTLSPVCLIAGSIRRMQPDPFPQLLESKGWKVVHINDGMDCLKLLQARVWDAILIDDDLPQLAGITCVTSLRQWEARNRALSQKNVFLVCDGYVPSPWDKNSIIQPPNGCNGVLRRPVPIDDFEYLLQTNPENTARGSSNKGNGRSWATTNG